MTEKTLQGFIEELSSALPTPGGGSASAMAGVMGASLLEMVCSLTIGKEKFKEHEAEISQTREEARNLRGILFSLMERDAQAFESLMRAFKMPKGTEEEKKKRSEEIQKYSKGATKAPLETASHCWRLLELCQQSVNKISPNTISDLGVSSWLSYAGLEGASLNVTINIPSIRDESFKDDSEKRLKMFREKGKKIKDQLRQQIERIMKG